MWHYQVEVYCRKNCTSSDSDIITLYTYILLFIFASFRSCNNFYSVLSRLKEISIQMMVNNTDQLVINTFFSNLPFLERSICCFDSEASVDHNEFMHLFLKNLLNGSPNLTHLSLSYIRKIFLPSELFRKLVESRLEVLDVEFCDLSTDGTELLRNFRLKKLGLVLWARNEDVSRLFLKTFVNLRHLKMSETGLFVLNMISNYQVRLWKNTYLLFIGLIGLGYREWRVEKHSWCTFLEDGK